MKKQLAIIGQTSSGKSELAINLAIQFNAIIFSIDSLSVYKFTDIASAKPSKKEREIIKHFGIDEIMPNENFNVGLVFEIYQKAKRQAKENNQWLFIVGGTSFYLDAMLKGLAPKVPNIKTNLSNDEIYKLICKFEPNYQINANDTYRLQKWYEIFMYIQDKNFKNVSEFLSQRQEPVIQNLKIFEIKTEKIELWDKILNRTKKMINDGLIDESKWLLENYPNSQIWNSIGLKECRDFLNNKINKNELLEQIYIHTRQLAKRQKSFNASKFLNKTCKNHIAIKDEIYKFCHNLS